MKTYTKTSVLLVWVIAASSVTSAMGGTTGMMSGNMDATSISGSTMDQNGMDSMHQKNMSGSIMDMHQSMPGTKNTMMHGTMTGSGMSGMMKQMHDGKKIAEMLKWKFRNNLTADEKNIVKTMVDSHVADMKQVRDDVITDHLKMMKICDTFINSLIPYLDPSKKDAFVEMMEDMKAMMEQGTTGTGAINHQSMMSGTDNKMSGTMINDSEMHSGISGKIKMKKLNTSEETIVRAKLKSIGNNQSHIDVILWKIEALLSGTASLTAKQKLQEIKDIILENTVSALPEAKPTPIVDLKNGDTYDIKVSRVKKQIDGTYVTMLAYNGSVPGPVIRAPKGATVKIRLTNNLGDLDTTLHSHGLRLDEASDGIPPAQGGITPVSTRSGNAVEYSIKFPDAGVFWYHPHIRDDIGQGMGLYGNYIISDTASGFTNPVNDEQYLMLTDILIENGKTASFPKDTTDHAIMGRYGNVLLVNGSDQYSLTAKKGDVVRLYLTNAASARTFNLSIPGAKIKLVGSDMGKYAKEAFVDSLIIAPAERYVVEAYFPKSGKFTLTHTTPDKISALGTIDVSEITTEKDNSTPFNTLKIHADVALEMSKFAPYYTKKADKNITFSLGMGGGMSGMSESGGMMAGAMSGTLPKDGLEWEDDMGAENAASNSNSTTWQITDTDAQKTNGDINWTFKKGDLVKIHITNDANTMHPMQHPFHIHGQRFIILNTDGQKDENPVWKDTVLVRAGQSVDILVDMSNPGNWITHCHITEHLHSGMGFGFSVK